MLMFPRMFPHPYGKNLLYPIFRHEVVNINLKNKPDWFLEKNNKGSVPTIELNGKVNPPACTLLPLPPIPAWFLKKNNKGSVPTIELNGKVNPPACTLLPLQPIPDWFLEKNSKGSICFATKWQQINEIAANYIKSRYLCQQ